MKAKKDEFMIRPVSLIVAVFLLLICSGCFWDSGRGGYDDRDRGGHEGERHDDRGGHDDHR